MDETGQAYSEHIYQAQLTHTTYTTQHMLVLSEKKPTAGSSQIKNTDTSRIDLSTVDYDKRLLSFFTWQHFVRDCRDIFIIFFV
jgi:hypothetical protein